MTVYYELLFIWIWSLGHQFIFAGHLSRISSYRDPMSRVLGHFSMPLSLSLTFNEHFLFLSSAFCMFPTQLFFWEMFRCSPLAYKFDSFTCLTGSGGSIPGFFLANLLTLAAAFRIAFVFSLISGERYHFEWSWRWDTIAVRALKEVLWGSGTNVCLVLYARRVAYGDSALSYRLYSISFITLTSVHSLKR